MEASGLWLGPEDVSCSFGVILANEEFESGARPSEMIAHAAGGVGLDHRVDPGGLKGALSKFGLGPAAKRLNDNEIREFHR
ncbi:MAG TPA: hypothetical protein VE077_08210 [Candidatus Methylomirabilis sp.]|nr:hypothetical protein [Candidatus Methylomirabilis sp.]